MLACVDLCIALSLSNVWKYVASDPPTINLWFAICNSVCEQVAKHDKPGNLVTAGHGEQPLALKNPVPRLNGVTGAHWDGSFPRLNFSAELPTSFSVRVSVSLI